jgi:hypothetical protein
MRVSCPWLVMAIGLSIGLASANVRAQEPADRPTKLPNVDRPVVKDVTPPELANLPEAPDLTAPPPVGGLYGSAEYLLMTPRQRNLDYAVVDPQNNLVPAGPIQSVAYHESSAFRVGIGYQFPSTGWDVGVEYTYLHGGGSSFANAPPGGLLYPELTRPGLTDSALAAIASAQLNYNVFDLEFGRTTDIDEWTQLRFFGGIRFASIYQTLNATYNGLLADTANVQSRSNFDGAGPLFGSEFRWKLGWGFSLFGRASGGLIYGNVRASLIETNNGGATTYADLSDRNRQMVPFAGVGLGVAWEYRGLTIRAGYEAVNWFSLIERPALIDSFSEGKLVPLQSDLSLDGFFLQMAFTF